MVTTVALLGMFALATFKVPTYSAQQLKNKAFVDSEIVRIKNIRKATLDKIKEVSPLQRLSLTSDLTKMNIVLEALRYVSKKGYDPKDEGIAKLRYFQRHTIPSLPVAPVISEASQRASKVYDISHRGIIPPKELKKADILVPPELTKSGVHGVVKIRVTIDEDGIPTDPHIIEGLSEPINNLVKKTITEKWRFKPATLDGHPVKIYYRIAIPFDIAPGGKEVNPKEEKTKK